MSQIRTALLGAELTPIAKVGGLGDVMGALPKALHACGADVRVFLPFYGVIDRSKLKLAEIKSGLALASDSRPFSIWETQVPNSPVRLYLLEHPAFGQEVYSVEQLAGQELLSNEPQKFIIYCEASLRAMETLDFRPDIAHLNDWHTAPFLAFLEQARPRPFWAKVRTLYTIHNLENQGVVETSAVRLPDSRAKARAELQPGCLNFMAMGIACADHINAVSPTYAKEILTEEQGAGLHELLRSRADDLSGILNGIDTEFFDPATDSALARRYDASQPEAKTDNKLALQKELGLPVGAGVMLAGLVSRLVGQKGLGVITERVAASQTQLVILGSGQKEIETGLLGLAARFPDKLKVVVGFDAALAQRIYAAADLFLMPSRFEPCGLGQLIAMRYGTLPLVRRTGGLADTVSSRVGFVFKELQEKDFLRALKRAEKLYYTDPAAWRARQRKAMSLDLSWKKSAKTYLKLYKKLLK